MNNAKKKISFNAPVTIIFAIISFTVVFIDIIEKPIIPLSVRYFSLYRIEFKDIGQYYKLVTYIIGHIDLEHYIGNMLLILLLGPIVEEKYGSLETLIMIVITAIMSGVIHLFVNPYVYLLGASGIAFMMVLLCAMSTFKGDKIPLTFILVAIMWIGREIYSSITIVDNVSRLGHIVGGVSGGIFGYLINKKKVKQYNF